MLKPGKWKQAERQRLPVSAKYTPGELEKIR